MDLAHETDPELSRRSSLLVQHKISHVHPLAQLAHKAYQPTRMYQWVEKYLWLGAAQEPQ